MTDVVVPHEPPAVLRMQRNGWPGKAISDFLRIPPLPLYGILERALEAENEAHRQGRPIHTPRLPKRW